MINFDNPNQTEIVKFTLPFSGRLNPKNKWIRLAEMIPWEELTRKYTRKMCKDSCQPSRWSGAGWLGACQSSPGLLLAL